MKARLEGGPGNGELHEVGEFPARRAYYTVEPVPFGTEVHRYDLRNVNADPSASEPRAIYRHRGKMPEVGGVRSITAKMFRTKRNQRGGA